MSADADVAVAFASDAPPARPRRRPPLKALTFLLALAALAYAKHRHNVAQVARELTLPQRTKAHVDRYERIRHEFGPILADHVGSDLDHLRAAVDPAGKAAGYPGWSAEAYGVGSAVHTFRDAAKGCTLQMHVTDGQLNTAWIMTEPFVDEPVRFWAAGEQTRKVAAIVAAMAWVVLAAGAYASRCSAADWRRWRWRARWSRRARRRSSPRRASATRASASPAGRTSAAR